MPRAVHTTDGSLSPEIGRLVLERAGLSTESSLAVRRIRSGNAVFRLGAAFGTYFLKIPSKDLEGWDDPLAGAAIRVMRERLAHQELADHGVPAASVLASEVGLENPVGRPYLLTSELEGVPFTEIASDRDRPTIVRALEAVGGFLGNVHALECERPGYLASGIGDVADGDPPQGSHDPHVEQSLALADLASARPHLSQAVTSDLQHRLGELASVIADEYVPPRFVLGAFHPNHPFVLETGSAFVVTGCVDLERASAGSPVDDLVTFVVGVMVQFRLGFPWWEPLFAAYGEAPSLDRFRLALLSTCAYCFGDLVGITRIEAVYRAIAEAKSWSELLNVHRAA